MFHSCNVYKYWFIAILLVFSGIDYYTYCNVQYTYMLTESLSGLILTFLLICKCRSTLYNLDAISCSNTWKISAVALIFCQSTAVTVQNSSITSILLYSYNHRRSAHRGQGGLAPPPQFFNESVDIFLSD